MALRLHIRPNRSRESSQDLTRHLQRTNQTLDIPFNRDWVSLVTEDNRKEAPFIPDKAKDIPNKDLALQALVNRQLS